MKNRQKINREVLHKIEGVKATTSKVGRFGLKLLVITLFFLSLFSSYTIYYWHQHNVIVWEFGLKVGQGGNVLYHPYTTARTPKKATVLHSKLPNEFGKVIAKEPKVLTKAEMVKNSKYPKFIDHIWEHESGRGTNDNPKGLHNICNAKGMSNEFGFYPSGDWCWNTFEEGVKRLELWRENEAKGLTENAALCKYNTGTANENCAYLGEDYISMN